MDKLVPLHWDGPDSTDNYTKHGRKSYYRAYQTMLVVNGNVTTQQLQYRQSHPVANTIEITSLVLYHNRQYDRVIGMTKWVGLGKEYPGQKKNYFNKSVKNHSRFNNFIREEIAHLVVTPKAMVVEIGSRAIDCYIPYRNWCRGEI